MVDVSRATKDSAFENFPMYVRRQSLARFMVRQHLFEKQLTIKGSIIEAGVHWGGGLFAWAQLSTILEPYNYHREVVGFDTFDGFPHISDRDREAAGVATEGMFHTDATALPRIEEQLGAFDGNRFLNHVPKVKLVQGDALKTIPRYVEDNPHVLISLLYLDFDLYEPTKVALEVFLPRMSKGAIVAFDEVHNPDWPGETGALLDTVGLSGHKLECLPYEPNVSFMVL